MPGLYIEQSFAPRWLRHMFAVGLPADDPVSSDDEFQEFCFTPSYPPVTVHRALAAVITDGLYRHELLEPTFGG